MPELLQDQATPEALADALLDQLYDPRRGSAGSGFREIHGPPQRDPVGLSHTILDEMRR